jgi:putative oxidoreductase
MATQTLHTEEAESHVHVEPTDARRYLAPLGRLGFAAIFILSGSHHFSSSTIGYAVSQGVPAANALVPLSGIIAIVGGLMVLFGYRTRLGAALLASFLVPVTFAMHRYWDATDAQTAMMQQVHFMKNISMLGGALLLCYFGGGALSLDARRRHDPADVATH